MDDARLDRFVATAEAAATAAGRIIRPFFRAASLRTETKSDQSPVTIADRQAEAAIRALITAAHPDHALTGEESGGELSGASTPFRWLIDPIDGTRAFITGRPTFGTLIALLHEGVPIVGIIDQPITGERWIGCLGRPTLFRGPFGGTVGTRPVTALAGVALAGAELSATSPAMFDDAERARFDRLAANVARVSWGGDCYAYGLLALGQIDLVVEASMKPWDWAALLPVVHGAGGTMSDWQGRPLSLAGAGQVLAAASPALSEAAQMSLTTTLTN